MIGGLRSWAACIATTSRWPLREPSTRTAPVAGAEIERHNWAQAWIEIEIRRGAVKAVFGIKILGFGKFDWPEHLAPAMRSDPVAHGA